MAKVFGINTKIRGMPNDIAKELLSPERMAAFQRFSEERNMPVYLILGTGGLPSTPEHLYLAGLSQAIDKFAFSRLLPGESVLSKVEGCEKRMR